MGINSSSLPYCTFSFSLLLFYHTKNLTIQIYVSLEIELKVIRKEVMTRRKN